MNGENPELVKVMLELGLKIPILYRITATMTIIRIAQQQELTQQQLAIH